MSLYFQKKRDENLSFGVLYYWGFIFISSFMPVGVAGKKGLDQHCPKEHKMMNPLSYLEATQYICFTCSKKSPPTKIMCLTHSYTNITQGIATYILVNITFQNILQRGNQWCFLQDNIVTNWNGRSMEPLEFRSKL